MLTIFKVANYDIKVNYESKTTSNNVILLSLKAACLEPCQTSMVGKFSEHIRLYFSQKSLQHRLLTCYKVLNTPRLHATLIAFIKRFDT